MSKSTAEESLRLHEQLHGKIATHGKLPVDDADALALAYTPGVAAACEAIADDPDRARELTWRKNAIAVVSDGSAVLGLGDIGPAAAMPVMEGKALLFREFAGIDAVPICLDIDSDEHLIESVRRLEPSFGGINLEDIAAPRCFAVERALQDLSIPVFHDDQHGTAIVTLAALLNACKIVDKDPTDLNIVISGAGAAGVAIARLLCCVGQDDQACQAVRDVIVCDSTGVIGSQREDLSEHKNDLLQYTNREDRQGSLTDAVEGADVFIGVSVGGLLEASDVQTMKEDAIIIAMANPEPEIMPDDARAGGAAVVGTGRSDFPNQVNNVLAFPGVFRGALDAGATRITEAMKLAAAQAIAAIIPDPEPDRVIPEAFDHRVAPAVARAVAEAAEV